MAVTSKVWAINANDEKQSIYNNERGNSNSDNNNSIVYNRNEITTLTDRILSDTEPKSYTTRRLEFEWMQKGQDIDGEGASDQSGSFMVLSADGTTLAIGASYNDPGTEGNLKMDAGHARVFRISTITNKWEQIGNDIDGDEAGDRFGTAIGLSREGRILAVGGFLHNNERGHVKVFKLQNTSWVQIGSDIDGIVEGGNFGRSIAMSDNGNIIAIGAPLAGDIEIDGIMQQNTGQVLIYEYSNQSDSYVQKGDELNGSSEEDSFGFAVAMAGDGLKIAVGMYKRYSSNGAGTGEARVFQFVDTSDKWIKVIDDIVGPSVEQDQFGMSVAISRSGDVVAIGAPFNDLNGYNSGMVQAFFIGDGQVESLGQPIGGESPSDASGVSIDLSDNGKTLAIGGFMNSGQNGFFSGHTRVFRFGAEDWEMVGSDIDGEFAADLFGRSVSLAGDGNLLAIGGPNNDGGNKVDAGHVRVFELISTSTDAPTRSPTRSPSVSPSNSPTVSPTVSTIPSNTPTASPTESTAPTISPTTVPTASIAPSSKPSAGPTSSMAPSSSPTVLPTVSSAPTSPPTSAPTSSSSPSSEPTVEPTVSSSPSSSTSATPTESLVPSSNPTAAPTVSSVPTSPPTSVPTSSSVPSSEPTVMTTVSSAPTSPPTSAPTDTSAPSSNPTAVPTVSSSPTSSPSGIPYVSMAPSSHPTVSIAPIATPSVMPTSSNGPSSIPSLSIEPTLSPGWRQKGQTLFEESHNSTIKSVAISQSGDLIAIGDSTVSCKCGPIGPDCGEVQVYHFSGDTWMPLGDSIKGMEPGTKLGLSVALSRSGDSLVIGSSNSASVYSNTNGEWNKIGTSIPEEAIGDFFGWSVSIADSGETVAIGGPRNTGEFGDTSGHTRIFKVGTNNEWIQVGKDLDGEGPFNFSGRAVGISADGKTVIIGAFGNSGLAGHARVFKFSNNTWEQIGLDIDGSASGNQFGETVDISSKGDIVAIGAPYSDVGGTESGTVKVFKNINDSWVQVGQNITESANESFGKSISLSDGGDVVAIGSRTSKFEKLRIYRYSPQMNLWVQVGEEAGLADMSVVDLTGYGKTLIGSGRNIVQVYQYGPPFDSPPTDSPTRGPTEPPLTGPSSTPSNKPSDSPIASSTLVPTIMPSSVSTLTSDPTVKPSSMPSIATSLGDPTNAPTNPPTKIKSAGPSKSPSTKPTDVPSIPPSESMEPTGVPSISPSLGNTVDFWQQLGGDIYGTSSGDRSGSSVSLSQYGNCVAIGAPFNDQNGANAGEVRVFRFSNSTWEQLGNTLRGENENTRFGTSVDLSSNCDSLAVGGILNSNESGIRSGHARLYKLNVNQWSQVAGDIDGLESGDQLGRSVSMSDDGNIIAVAAPKADQNGIVQIFEYSTESNSFGSKGQKIKGIAAGDLFGHSISLSSLGNSIAIGSFGYDSFVGDNTGRVEVFSFDGNSWVEKGGPIYGSNPFDQTGFSVSLSSDGETVAVGTPFRDAGNKIDVGMVQIYRLFEESWQKLGQNILCDDADSICGYSVSLSSSGNTVAFGSLLNSGSQPTNSDSDHVFVYELDGHTEEWKKVGINILNGDGPTNFYGRSVSLSSDGQRLAVSSPEAGLIGKVQVYDRLAIAYPSSTPSNMPSFTPSESLYPSSDPTSGPSISPSSNPTEMASATPTSVPTISNSPSTSASPTDADIPNNMASVSPSISPSDRRITDYPSTSAGITRFPSSTPTLLTALPTVGMNSSEKPSMKPSSQTSNNPTIISSPSEPSKTSSPTIAPTPKYSTSPSIRRVPSESPTTSHSSNPTEFSPKTATPSSTPTFWDLIGNIDGATPGDYFGWSVALSDNAQTIAVGSIFDSTNGEKAGSVHIFRYSDEGYRPFGNPIYGAKGDNLGTSLALTEDGNSFIVGANKGDSANGADSGEVRVYIMDPDQGWIQKGSSIYGTSLGDQTGVSVDISNDGSIIAIGSAFNTNGGGNSAGRVRVFEYAIDRWIQIGRSIFGESSYDGFGSTLSLAGDGRTIGIGGPTNDRSEGLGYYYGHVRMFRLAAGEEWEQMGADIDGIDQFGLFGTSISLSQNGNIVGIGKFDGVKNGVSIYEFTNGQWNILGAEIPFGISVSLSNDGQTSAIGDYKEGLGAGEVRIFKYSNGSWNQIGESLMGAGKDQFGRSVAISGNGRIVVAGAPGYNGQSGARSGKIEVYNNSSGSQTSGWLRTRDGQDFTPHVVSSSSSTVSTSAIACITVFAAFILQLV